MLRINLLIGKTAAEKNSDIFLRIIHKTCKIKLTLLLLSTFHIFIFAYISYQMYEIWSCVTFCHLLNRFLQPNDNCISTSWKWFNIEVYRVIHGFILNWTFLKFLDFYEKIPLLKEEDLEKLFWLTRKIPNIFKNVPEKLQKFQSHLSRFSPLKT